jgi:hypothetical protein
MTMKTVILAMGIGLAACGGGSHGAGNGNDNGPDLGMDPNATGRFEAFTPATRGAAYVHTGATDLFLISTNAQGAIGCSLTDPTANPGQAVSRVMYTLLDESGDIPPVCGPKASAIGAKATGRFERWDANGNKTHSVKAIGGAASFASSAAGADLSRCDVTITLTFPGGGVFTDAFSYNYNGNGTITQACIQGQACSCQPWQGCDPQNKCVDLACVSLQEVCPADGSVGCCNGSCNDGKCCYPAGTACTPGTTSCCYSCDYLNNQIYHGWYCTHP